jgi:hypothetical protein
MSGERHALLVLTQWMNQSTHLMGGWVGPQVLDSFWESKNPFSVAGFEPGSSQWVA